MKALKYIISALILLTMTVACEDDFGNTDVVNSDVAPSEVSAKFTVSQDNSGLVKITPTATGVVAYNIYFGDDTAEPKAIKAGSFVAHTYSEGSYKVRVVAISATGKKTEVSLPLEVAFKAPENLQVSIENDKAVSKKVNVTVTADHAVNYEVYFGEADEEEPISANIGDAVSHTYKEAGTYTITVEVKGAAIATTKYVETFEVKAIEQPITAAPTPAARAGVDVISLFSDKYTPTSVDMFVTDWSSVEKQEEIAIEGNTTLVYRALNYAGIITETSPINAAAMENFHFDIWSNNVTTFKIKFVDFNGTGYNGGTDNIEFEVANTITEAGKWQSFDIPLSAFTGVPFADINQIVISCEPAGGTVFLDNMYFWRQPTAEAVGALPLDFESEYTLSSFDGGGAEIIDNPDANGNNSAKVLQLVKGAGQVWAGSKVTADNQKYDISEGMVVKAKVWSPRTGLKLLMKFEDATPWPDTKATAETVVETTVANAWEELSFVITGVDASVEYSNLVLIMDNGTAGDGSANYTIYLDDITIADFLSFEGKFALSSFDGGGAEVIDNPDANGNNSAKVLQLVKGAGQVWAGSKITVSKTPYAITEGVVIKAKVWSPRAGLKLLMKFEDATPWPDTKATAETVVETTASNAWEELSFVITGVDASVEYSNLVLIMDNGTAGDGSANYTIYVDDIAK